MNFYRFFSSHTKAIIVLEGLAGKPTKDICQEYNITESQYRRWRKLFLRLSPQVFEGSAMGGREEPACPAGKRSSLQKSKKRKEETTCPMPNNTAAS